jgi:lipopolysaccharide biosynthesis protein
MSDSTSLRVRYRTFRKKLVSFTPFVKRHRHEKILARLTDRLNRELERERGAKEQLAYLFLDRPPLAAAARILLRAPLTTAATDELCLFVTHAPHADIKPHVVDHVESLLDAGIPVVLIINTDLDLAAVRIPLALAARLHGCIVRENVGYDFGAWAHAYGLIGARAVRLRLYLINDSIIGPLDREAYRTLLARIRASRADFVGLTTNPEPRDHLQSYFLVFNEPLLHAAVFDEAMRSIVNLPSKELVIDCYEVRLTSWLERAGFHREAMFPHLRTDPQLSRNDTIWSWRQLLDTGFPFVKSGVLGYAELSDEARRVIPARYLDAIAAPQAADRQSSP